MKSRSTYVGRLFCVLERGMEGDWGNSFEPTPNKMAAAQLTIFQNR
ncbi:protein of unknown function [Maridesulfovibrio hydrothermalis AM13 = DSM 14728]|uniref:Uncharacterized protein n=1 Tax=Maridesulfovibrio hydrothermalis AM13 = DSM 14728 TaxID=1121451 RepID=L0RCI3_9BACT|nr:protein of unknown function [Maridesulfovibrio hydrothermalis AM13 = DSM 14728]